MNTENFEKEQTETSAHEPEHTFALTNANQRGPEKMPDLTHWSRSRALNIRKQIAKLKKSSEKLKGQEKRECTMKIKNLILELQPFGGLEHLPGDPWEQHAKGSNQ